MAARIEIVTDFCALEALRPAWRALHAAAGGGPFSSVEWIEAWGAAFGAGAAPRIGCAWRDGELVAALPLGLRRAPLWRGGPRLRRLGMLCDDRAGFHDLLAAPGHEDAAAALMGALMQTPGAALADLSPMRAGAALSGLGLYGALDGWRSRQRVEIRAAIADHEDGAEAWLARRSREFRKSLRSGRRALERQEHRLMSARSGQEASGGAAGAILEGALRLSSRTWKAQMGTDIGTDQATRRFFGQLWQRMPAGRDMVVHLLTIGGEEAASLICLETGGVSHAMILDIDERFSKLSPGRVMLTAGIEAAAARGLASTNMLRSTGFVERFCDRSEAYARLRLCRRFGRADMLLGAQELLRPVGRRARKVKRLRTGKRPAFVK